MEVGEENKGRLDINNPSLGSFLDQHRMTGPVCGMILRDFYGMEMFFASFITDKSSGKRWLITCRHSRCFRSSYLHWKGDSATCGLMCLPWFAQTKQTMT